MPGYRYKCFSCYAVTEMFLPISTDPDKLFVCPSCPDGHTRRIIGASPSAVIGLKTFAGDWFKKTYGHELGEDGESNEEKKRDFERALKEQQRDK